MVSVNFHVTSHVYCFTLRLPKGLEQTMGLIYFVDAASFKGLQDMDDWVVSLEACSQHLHQSLVPMIQNVRRKSSQSPKKLESAVFVITLVFVSDTLLL